MKRLLLAALLALSGCTSHDRTVYTLEQFGYSQIQTGGYSFFACEDYDIRTKFTAVNPAGRRVSGVVCCKGFVFGSCTIHF